MAYLAIARKWRPHKFEDLVGQEHVVQTLKNAILLGRVSHAYLFSGARGIGKTSVARIFAKALRCPNAREAVPCNVCPECVAISESRSVDVAEIDGASHNGVEAVRGIRDNVAYSASSGTYKIYIIDEVHMLSLSAFNALLKTLEEPPSHVVFIFATTEAQKIPVTILSRCQRFEFRRLSQTQIVERLKFILEQEKVTAAEVGLRTIAQHADGSLRDALSLLDQVLSHGGGSTHFDEAQIVMALGVNPTSASTELLSAIVRKDTGAVLQEIQRAHQIGVDFKHFAEQLLEELRLLYLVVLSRENRLSLNPDEMDISTGHLARIQHISMPLSLLQVERMAQILSRAVGQLGWSSLPRFVLEMAAVRMGQVDVLEKMERLLSGKSRIAVEPQVSPITPAAPVPKIVPTEKRAQTSAAAQVNATEKTSPPVVENSAPEVATPAPLFAASARAATEAATGNWASFVDSLMKRRPLLGSLLGHAEFQIDADKKVILSFAEGSFYERQANDAKNRAEIEGFLKNYFGPEVTLAVASAGSGTIKSIEHSKQVENAALKKSALEHPTVLQMQQILGAEVVDVNVEL